MTKNDYKTARVELKAEECKNELKERIVRLVESNDDNKKETLLKSIFNDLDDIFDLAKIWGSFIVVDTELINKTIECLG